MSGNKNVFDTNALINFFLGQQSLQVYSKESIIISIITVAEFLSFPRITSGQKKLFFDFLKEVEIINLEYQEIELLNLIVTLRKTYKLKLPDSIIAATALHTKSKLISNDRDFSKISTLNVLNY